MDCRQFVEHGCLGYLVMALSSREEEVRAAAGHTLTRFSHHLEGARFREKAHVRGGLREGGREGESERGREREREREGEMRRRRHCNYDCEK